MEKESGSGNIIMDRSELEAERQIGSDCGGNYNSMLSFWQNPENKEPSGRSSSTREWETLAPGGTGFIGMILLLST